MWFQKPPLGTPLDWGNPLNDGTVLALAMNEGHGDKVQDLSMNGNHGTLENFAFPPTVDSGWNPGQTGVGLNFDPAGSNHVDCGSNESLKITDAITISAIIKPNTGYGQLFPRVLQKNYAEHGGWDWYITAASGVLGTVIQLDTGICDLAFSSPIVENETTVLVMTYDGNVMHGYSDGVISTNSVVKSGIIQTNNDAFQIGGINTRYFDGQIDQPRIMNRAWSAKEVKDYAINPWQVYLDE